MTALTSKEDPARASRIPGIRHKQDASSRRTPAREPIMGGAAKAVVSHKGDPGLGLRSDLVDFS
jgi:hypothetical protein